MTKEMERMAETEEAVVATTPAPTERLPLAQPQKKTRKTVPLAKTVITRRVRRVPKPALPTPIAVPMVELQPQSLADMRHSITKRISCSADECRQRLSFGRY